MLLILLVLTTVSHTEQHYYYPGVDYCGLSVACIHDGRPICAATPDGCGRRTFLDQCDMFEFNCDFGTRYQETYFFYCQTANYVVPATPPCHPGIYVIPPFVEVVNEKENEIVPITNKVQRTTTITSSIISVLTSNPSPSTKMSTSTEIKTTTTTTAKTTESPTISTTETTTTTTRPPTTTTTTAATTTTTTTVMPTTITTTTVVPTTTTTTTVVPITTSTTKAPTTTASPTTTEASTTTTTTMQAPTTTTTTEMITTQCCDRPKTWETTEGEVPPIITDLFDPPKTVITTFKTLITTTTESPTTTTEARTERTPTKSSAETTRSSTTSKGTLTTTRSTTTTTKGIIRPNTTVVPIGSPSTTPCCDRPNTWDTTKIETRMIDYTESKVYSTATPISMISEKESPENKSKIETIESSEEGTEMSSTNTTSLVTMSPVASKTAITTEYHFPSTVTTSTIETTENTTFLETNSKQFSSSTPCCDKPHTWETTPIPPLLYHEIVSIDPETHPSTFSTSKETSVASTSTKTSYDLSTTTTTIYTSSSTATSSKGSPLNTNTSPSSTITTYTTPITTKTSSLVTSTSEKSTKFTTLKTYTTASTPCCDRPITWETITTSWKLITDFISTSTPKSTIQSKPYLEPESTIKTKPTFESKSTPVSIDDESTEPATIIYTTKIFTKDDHSEIRTIFTNVTKSSTIPKVVTNTPTYPFTESITLPSITSQPESEERSISSKVSKTPVSLTTATPKVLRITEFTWWYPTLCESDDCKRQRPVTWRTTVGRKKIRHHKLRNHV